jgi:hypothetical protein
MVGILDHAPGVTLDQAAAAVLLYRVGTVLFAALFGGLVYWFGWHPSKEKKENGPPSSSVRCRQGGGPMSSPTTPAATPAASSTAAPRRCTILVNNKAGALHATVGVEQMREMARAIAWTPR